MKRLLIVSCILACLGFRHIERRPPSGMVAGYTFNHADARNVTGTTAALSLNNGASVSGGVILTDGSNDYAQSPTSNPVSGSAITVMLWMKADSYTNTAFPQVAVQNYSSTGNPYTQWGFQVQNVSSAMRIAGSLSLGTSRAFSVSDGYSSGVWYHVAITYDGATQRLYVDGEEVDSTSRSGTLSSTTGRLEIGRWAGGSYFDGCVDDLLIFDYALTATEVVQLYHAGRTP